MATKERIEFRVEKPTKRLLEDLANSRGVSLGELMRSLVEERLSGLGWRRSDTRAQAAQDLLSLSVGTLPKPDQLKRKIADAFTSGQ